MVLGDVENIPRRWSVPFTVYDFFKVLILLVKED